MTLRCRNSLKVQKINRKPLSMVIEEENEEAQGFSKIDNIEVEEENHEIQMPYIQENYYCGSIMTPIANHSHLNN